MNEALYQETRLYLSDLLKGERRAYSLGLGQDADSRSGGLEPEHLTVVAGQNKDGKTSLSVNTVYAALNADVNTLVITTEVSAKWYIYRLVSRITGVPLTKLRTGRLTTEETEDFKAGLEALRESPFHVADRPRCTLGMVREAIEEHCPAIAVVDHFQRLDPETSEIAVGYKRVAQGLKELAVSYKTAMLVLSQVVVADGWCSPVDGDFLYDITKMRTRWTNEIQGEADKLMFFHNIGRQMPVYPNRGHLIYHSMRDYPSEGYSPLYVDLETQYINGSPRQERGRYEAGPR